MNHVAMNLPKTAYMVRIMGLHSFFSEGTPKHRQSTKRTPFRPYRYKHPDEAPSVGILAMLFVRVRAQEST